MSKHLVITGTKDGANKLQKDKLHQLLDRSVRAGFDVMHNGDCIGVDETAAYIWKKRFYRTLILHPPTDPKYRAWIDYADTVLPTGDYIKRDHDMVDLSSLLIGVSKTPAEYLRSGTWATIRYARKIGINRLIIYPNGSVVHEPGDALAGLIA